MKKIVYGMLSFMYFLAAGWVLMSANAHAYIDPSAVTYVIQAVAGVLIALGALITVFRHKIAAFFKKGKGGSEKKEIHFEEEEDSKSEDTKEE